MTNAALDELKGSLLLSPQPGLSDDGVTMVKPHCGCSTLSSKVYVGVSMLIVPLSMYCSTATAVQAFVTDPPGTRLRVHTPCTHGRSVDPATTPAAASFTPSAHPKENEALKRSATASSLGCTAAVTSAAVGTYPV